MNQILISDPFLFPPSGEDFISLDGTLGNNYFITPPENFVEFTRKEFNQTWADFELLQPEDEKGLFGDLEDLYESDSGFSSSSSCTKGETDMDSTLSQLSEAVFGNFLEDLDIPDLLDQEESFGISDFPSDLNLDLPLSDDMLSEIEFESNMGEDKSKEPMVIAGLRAEPGFLHAMFSHLNVNPTVVGMPEPEEQALVENNLPQQQSRRKCNLRGSSSAELEPIIFEGTSDLEKMAADAVKARNQKAKPRVAKGRIAKKTKGKNKKETKKEKATKMHELDPAECPEAKNAVAAFRRRQKSKEEKTAMSNRILELEQQNRRIKPLEEENQRLKQILAQLTGRVDGTFDLNNFEQFKTALHIPSF